MKNGFLSYSSSTSKNRILCHNANVERVFSMMSAQWTDERNKLDVANIEAIFSVNGICIFIAKNFTDRY